MTAPLEPCCSTCHRALDDPSDAAIAADPAVLGECPVHGAVKSGAEWWGVAIPEEAHRIAAGEHPVSAPKPPQVKDIVGFRVVGTVPADLGDGRLIVQTPYGDFSCQADKLDIVERRGGTQ